MCPVFSAEMMVWSNGSRDVASLAAALSAKWFPYMSWVYLLLSLVSCSLWEWMCCTRFRVVGRCRWRILTSGACDEACIFWVPN